MLYHLDVDSRPWDFQAEECALRAAVDRFNQRRYDKGNFSDSENDNMVRISIPTKTSLNGVVFFDQCFLGIRLRAR